MTELARRFNALTEYLLSLARKEFDAELAATERMIEDGTPVPDHLRPENHLLRLDELYKRLGPVEEAIERL